MAVPYRPGPGLMNGRRYVHNVFAYDAQGNPITGVQLFDQKGRPLAVNEGVVARGHTVTYPWLNGSTGLYSVFPLPTRQQRRYGPVDGAWESDNPPLLAQPPLAVVPPGSLPSQPEAEADAEPETATGRAGKHAGSTDSEKSG